MDLLARSVHLVLTLALFLIPGNPVRGQVAVPGAAESAADHSSLVVTGRDDPRLIAFDRLMTDFIARNHVPGAALAVTRQGRLVYARGFGDADPEARQPVQPNSLFRIASVSKPLTAVAVLQLVERKRLGLEDRMVDVLGLALRGSNPDRRLERITIRELLQHRAGWNRETSFDPMFRPLKIAREMGVPPPAGPAAILRYMLGMPLQFEPGERYAYSNFGYCVLGRVIEKVSGQSYEAYVTNEVLRPLGIHDMRIGRTLPEHRAPGEVHYVDRDHGKGRGVVGSTIGRQVPLPYGAWYLEGMDAHGGWIASAPDLVRFASALDDPGRCPILCAQGLAEMFERPPGRAGFQRNGQPRATYYGCGWQVRPEGPAGRRNTWHTGQLDGTSALLVRRHDGLDWAVLFNTDANPEGKDLANLIDPLVHAAADAVQAWPEIDLFPQFLAPVSPASASRSH